MAELAPALPLFIGALLAGMTRGRLRAVLMIAAPMAGALGLLFLPPGTEITAQFLGQHLTPVRVDELSFSSPCCSTWPP